MDSRAWASRYISLKSNIMKRAFLAGSSSSACKEVEALDISSSYDRASKPKLSKQKEVFIPEVIDVDVEDDCDVVMLTDGDVDPSMKGKGVLLNSPAGIGSFTDGDDIVTSINDSGGMHDVDEFDNNLFFGEDQWVETYYDDIIYDDFADLDSHFDHMDIPPGVEAPFPWIPSSPWNNAKVPSNSTSRNPSLNFRPYGVGLPPGLDPSQPSFPSNHSQTGIQSSLGRSKIDTQLNAFNRHKTKQLSSKLIDHVRGKQKATTSSGTSSNMRSLPPMDLLVHRLDKKLAKIKKKSRTYEILYSNYHRKFPLPPLSPSNVNGGGSLNTFSIPTFPLPPLSPSNVNGGGSLNTFSIPTNSHGGETYMPVWPDMPLGTLEPSLAPFRFNHGSAMNGRPQDSASNQNGASSMGTASSPKVGQRNMEEILQNFDKFKKFDTVEDFSDHHYATRSSAGQHSKSWAKKIQDEWKILKKDLPDTIFVRVSESRMDLLRAVIVGADGTPYHDGLFFFDVSFPAGYPDSPPLVHYHSRGLRINPNLYACGKVCLSLLNTWTGSQKEKWIPGVSTMLQVLVSIQGLILNAKPYFNEPGFAKSSGSANGENKSLEYNEMTFIYSLRTMVYNMKNPPKHFEDVVMGHFCKRAHDILVSCKSYLDGAQVGCLVKGGVQDVDEGDKSCSDKFKKNLTVFISTLVKWFLHIGAKDCREFLSLGDLK